MNETGQVVSQLELFAASPGTQRSRERLLDLLIDAVGVGAAGSSAAVARRCLPALDGDDAASHAWMRGVCMHALDFDDTHEPSLCHTGTALIPGLLGLGMRRPTPGRALLDAFEVGLRFVEFLSPLGPRINAMGLHSTGILGTLGSAAATAWLLTEEPATAARAVEIASLMTGGLGVAFGNDGKAIQAGRASEAGMRAALLAAAGVEAPIGGALGPRGIFALWLGGNAPAQARWDDLCAEAPLNVAVKPYPSCFLTHSTIDATTQLRDALHVSGPDEVAQLEVTVHPIARDLADKIALRTANDAKFSLRYCVLAALSGEASSIPAFEPSSQARLTRSGPWWEEWTRRCQVRVDDTAPRLAVTASLVTIDGREAQVTVESPSGSVNRPLDREAVAQKFQRNFSATEFDPAGLLGELIALPGTSDIRGTAALAAPWTLTSGRMAESRAN